MAWGSCYSPDFRVASVVGASALSTAQAYDRRLVEGINGTPTFVADAIDVGRYALRCSLTGVAANILLAPVAATPRYSGLVCRFAVSSAFGTAFDLVRIVASTTTESVKVRVGATGLLMYSFNDGGAYTTTAVQFTQGAVYRLEVFVDWNTGTTHTLKIRLNGSEVVNTTGGAAIVTGGNMLVGGFSAASGMVVDLADMATYNDVAQYGVLSDWRVLGLEPTADGTHSFTTNYFQDQASANLFGSTTVWTLVDDAPGAAPSTADFVKQVTLQATQYVDVALRALPDGYGAPLLVALSAALHPVGAATANTVAFRLVSGSNVSAEAAVDTSVAQDTLEYRKHHYTVEPVSAAAWTRAMAQAPLHARFGFSSDATPPPALDSIMAFVLVENRTFAKVGGAYSAGQASGSRAGSTLCRSGGAYTAGRIASVRARDVVGKVGGATSAAQASGVKAYTPGSVTYDKLGGAYTAAQASGSRAGSTLNRSGSAGSALAASGLRGRDIAKAGSGVASMQAAGSRAGSTLGRTGTAVFSLQASGVRGRDITKTGGATSAGQANGTRAGSTLGRGGSARSILTASGVRARDASKTGSAYAAGQAAGSRAGSTLNRLGGAYAAGHASGDKALGREILKDGGAYSAGRASGSRAGSTLNRGGAAVSTLAASGVRSRDVTKIAAAYASLQAAGSRAGSTFNRSGGAYSAGQASGTKRHTALFTHTNGLEGANGVAITVGNSGADPFTVISASAPTYSTVEKKAGASSLGVLTEAATPNSRYAQWGDASTNAREVDGDYWVRCYIRPETIPGTSAAIMQLYDTASVRVASLRIKALTGVIDVVNSGGSVYAGATGAVALDPAAWNRVDLRVNPTLGQVEFYLRKGVNLEQPHDGAYDDHVSMSGLALSGNGVLAFSRFGYLSGSSGPTSWQSYIDDVAESNQAWLAATGIPVNIYSKQGAAYSAVAATGVRSVEWNRSGTAVSAGRAAGTRSRDVSVKAGAAYAAGLASGLGQRTANRAGSAYSQLVAEGMRAVSWNRAGGAYSALQASGVHAPILPLWPLLRTSETVARVVDTGERRAIVVNQNEVIPG